MSCWLPTTSQAYVNNEKVAVYGPGGSFGELALMYNSERAATVRATSASRLWTMDLSTFRRMLATTANRHIVTRCEFLRKVSLLEDLNNEQARWDKDRIGGEGGVRSSEGRGDQRQINVCMS